MFSSEKDRSTLRVLYCQLISVPKLRHISWFITKQSCMNYFEGPNLFLFYHTSGGYTLDFCNLGSN